VHIFSNGVGLITNFLGHQPSNHPFFFNTKNQELTLDLAARLGLDAVAQLSQGTLEAWEFGMEAGGFQ